MSTNRLELCAAHITVKEKKNITLLSQSLTQSNDSFTTEAYSEMAAPPRDEVRTFCSLLSARWSRAALLHSP